MCATTNKHQVIDISDKYLFGWYGPARLPMIVDKNSGMIGQIYRGDVIWRDNMTLIGGHLGGHYRATNELILNQLEGCRDTDKTREILIDGGDGCPVVCSTAYAKENGLKEYIAASNGSQVPANYVDLVFAGL
jgi:hypothetical protein